MHTRLDSIITDTKFVADYLGVTVQAVNQFKNGTSFPKIENLIRISEFYGCSVDYILGLTDCPKPYVPISEYTGLSEKAINSIIHMNKETSGTLNKLFEELSK